MKDQINSTLSLDEEIAGGASVLPYNSGLNVRLLGDRASQLRRAIFDVIRITNKIILTPNSAESGRADLIGDLFVNFGGISAIRVPLVHPRNHTKSGQLILLTG